MENQISIIYSNDPSFQKDFITLCTTLRRNNSYFIETREEDSLESFHRKITTLEDPELIIISSLEGIESLIHKKLMKEGQVVSIEHVDQGFSKGHTRTREILEKVFLATFIANIKTKPMILILSGAEQQEFLNPYGQPYSQFRPRIHPKSYQAVERFADNILFACDSSTWNPTEGGDEESSYTVFSRGSVGFIAKSSCDLPRKLSLKDLQNALTKTGDSV